MLAHLKSHYKLRGSAVRVLVGCLVLVKIIYKEVNSI